MSDPVQYYLVSAFTDDPYAGNPAAVVFIDLDLPFERLAGISANFNQPMTVFLSLTAVPSDDPRVHVRKARFVTASGEDSAVCGHGSIAAAKVMFTLMGIAEDTIEFRAHMGAILTAKRMPQGFIELSLPAAEPVDLPPNEQARLKPYINKAFSREVSIRALKYGGSIYPQYLFVELDENEDLQGSVVDPEALRNNGFSINAFTSSSKDPNFDFVSRMFSPLFIPGGEDPVCGSMHGLLGPYWERKRGFAPGTQMKTRQVSPRGGVLKVGWDSGAEVVRLQGQCAVFASGTLLS